MPTYTNTRTLLGDQGALDALVSDTMTIFADDSVKTLRSGAFFARKQLQEVYLPNLENLTNNAFMQCTALKKVFVGLNSETVLPGSGSFSLDQLPGRALLYVPDALVSAYRAASRYTAIASRIFGVSDEGKYEWDDSEIADSWTEIINNVTNGAAASRYHVGQYKTIDLYTEGIITFRIVGINTDELASGSGTAQLTWIADQVLSSPIYYDNVGSTVRWKDSVVRAALESDILPLFPEEIRNAIKPVKKYSRAYGSDVISDDLTTDKLWIPGAREVFMGAGNIPKETLGPMYAIPFAQTSFIGRKNLNGNSTFMFLRSAWNSASIICFTGSGSQSSNNKSNSLNFAIGFCT